MYKRSGGTSVVRLRCNKHLCSVHCTISTISRIPNSRCGNQVPISRRALVLSDHRTTRCHVARRTMEPRILLRCSHLVLGIRSFCDAHPHLLRRANGLEDSGCHHQKSLRVLRCALSRYVYSLRYFRQEFRTNLSHLSLGEPYGVV